MYQPPAGGAFLRHRPVKNASIAVDVESIGEVLCITVPEQHSKPYSFGGKFFIREGAGPPSCIG